MKKKVTNFKKSFQLGSMVTVHRHDPSNIINDPIELAEHHFDWLVNWVCERGLLQRSPKNFPLNLPKSKQVSRHIRAITHPNYGKRVLIASPDVFLLVHNCVTYHERLQPELTSLERHMMRELYRAQSNLSSYQHHYQAGNIQQAAIFAWELGRDILTIYAALKFNDDVKDGLPLKFARLKAGKTTGTKYAERHAALRKFFQPRVDEYWQGGCDHIRACQKAAAYYNDHRKDSRFAEIVKYVNFGRKPGKPLTAHTLRSWVAGPRQRLKHTVN